MDEAIQSTGCKFVLKCGHPHSSSEISDFKVESGVCCKGLNYNLDSDSHSKHIIYRHSPKNYSVLIYKKYKFTLRQWLEKKENKDNWCLFYRNLNVCRPKEAASEIIQGILRAVYELHCTGSFHGFLYHSENFAIYDDESMIAGERKKTKCILLLHENVDFNEEFFYSPEDEIKLGQKNDMDAVLHVIFNKILGMSSSPPDSLKHFGVPLLQDLLKLRQDLQNLPEQLQNFAVSSREWNENWKRIVDHPSLWDWKSRFSYFDRVQMQFVHAKPAIQRSMSFKFKYIIMPKDWRQMVPAKTPLETVLYYNGDNYGTSAKQLLRYLRNVYVHHRDGIDTNTRATAPYGGVQSNEKYGKFIEHEITVIFEHFLLDLYDKMWYFL